MDSSTETWAFRQTTENSNANVIDKLAEYVRSNGPEFYSILLQRQGNNPRYGFIHPGHPDHPYFTHKMRHALGIGHQQYRLSRNKNYTNVQFNRGNVHSAQADSKSAEEVPIPGLGSGNVPTKFAERGIDSLHPPTVPVDNFVSDLRERVMSVAKSSTEKNVRDCRSWIFRNCRNPKQFQLGISVVQQTLALVDNFKWALGILYLISDIVYYAYKKEIFWAIPESKFFIPPILKAVYSLAGNQGDNVKNVEKVLEIWERKGIFDQCDLHAFKTYTGIPLGQIAQPAPLDKNKHPEVTVGHSNIGCDVLPSQTSTETHSDCATISKQKYARGDTPSEKQQEYTYFDLPASSIITAMSRHSRRSPYSPVESSYLEPYDGSVTRPKELAEAVEDFYLGLDDAISAAKRSSRHATLESEAQLGPAFDVETIVYDDAAEGKDIASEDKYDEDGWETGYLSHWRSSVQGNLTLDDRRRGVNIPDNATAARDTLSGGHGAPTANPRSRGSPRSSHCGPNDLSDGDDGQYRSTSPTC